MIARTAAATSAATGIFPFHINIDPLPEGFVKVSAPYFYPCEFDLEYPACNLACGQEMEETIEEEGPETIAAFIAEPVIGPGGVIPPPDKYFPRIREICDRYDILLVLDEVITGFGRTGAMFGHEHWGGSSSGIIRSSQG